MWEPATASSIDVEQKGSLIRRWRGETDKEPKEHCHLEERSNQDEAVQILLFGEWDYGNSRCKRQCTSCCTYLCFSCLHFWGPGV